MALLAKLLSPSPPTAFLSFTSNLFHALFSVILGEGSWLISLNTKHLPETSYCEVNEDKNIYCPSDSIVTASRHTPTMHKCEFASIQSGEATWDHCGGKNNRWTSYTQEVTAEWLIHWEFTSQLPSQLPFHVARTLGIQSRTNFHMWMPKSLSKAPKNLCWALMPDSSR